MSTHLSQQHKGMATPQASRLPALPLPCRRRFGLLARIGTGGYGLLQALDISELLVAGCDCLVRQHPPGAVGQQPGSQLQAAATAQGQLRAIVQVHRHGASGARFKLLPGKQPIAFDQQSTHAIVAYRKHLTNHFADHTDKPSHERTSPLPGRFLARQVR
ncbi:hypothetical protein PS627_04380 [Pseudomonas fluorescens]|nr:hypothetical protein PS627_04380 [Pseudomonas fluorescens]